MARLTFAGGVGSVTGSKFLIEHDGASVLVDCGLYQGPRKLRSRNWDAPPVDARSLDAVVVTHAHIDHVGYTPRLHKDGFTGAFHATRDTVALASIVLPDSGHLQEEEADYANRKGYSKHHPARPLYTEADARTALRGFVSHGFATAFDVAPGIRCTFRRAGHILGSASVVLEVGESKRIVISGDLGTGDHPLLLPPDTLDECDVVLCESTYGNRPRPDIDVADQLAAAIEDTISRGGVVLIPAFAVDRTEIVLYHIAELVRAGRIPHVPVWVDSPMASAALSVYRSAADRGAADLRPHVLIDELFAPLDVRESRTVEQSKELNRRRGPMIIVSASGMATGGRILHHLASRLRNDRNAIVLVGFQAPGTRGRSLLEGAGSIKFFGSYHPVQARVHAVELSAHADQAELLAWLGSAATDPGTVFAVHGEPDASDALAFEAQGRGLNAVVPRFGEQVVF